MFELTCQWSSLSGVFVNITDLGEILSDTQIPWQYLLHPTQFNLAFSSAASATECKINLTKLFCAVCSLFSRRVLVVVPVYQNVQA